MRTFFVSAYYSYKGLFFWGGPAVYFTQRIILPFAQIAFFSLMGIFGGSQSPEFYLIGNTLVIGSLSGFTIALAITAERGMGTLVYLIGSPANRVALFLGRSTYYLVEGVVYVVIGLGCVILVFGLDLPSSSWGGILLAILVGTVAVCGLGLLLGALAYLMLDAMVLGNLMVFTLLLVSGANVPLDELPSCLELIGLALPLTRSIEAARGLAAGGGLEAAIPLLLGDLGMGLAYGILGLLLFGWLETQARRRGSLEEV
jgi:ABC-2 type transport system permease protein